MDAWAKKPPGLMAVQVSHLWLMRVGTAIHQGCVPPDRSYSPFSDECSLHNGLADLREQANSESSVAYSVLQQIISSCAQ